MGHSVVEIDVNSNLSEEELEAKRAAISDYFTNEITDRATDRINDFNDFDEKVGDGSKGQQSFHEDLDDDN